MRSFIYAMVTSLALVACGGSDGSGLDSGKALGTLTASEMTTLCEYIVEQFPSEPVECGPDDVYEPQTVAECAEDTFPETCTATVNDAEACAEALGADVCSDTFPAACANLFECFGQ